jgi:transcription-repair coupling factor (superfamily II helicase)
MTIKELFSAYAEHPKTAVLVDAIRATNQTYIKLSGLIGSSPSFFVTAVHLHTQQSQLILLDDKEQAIYFYNDLQNLLEEKQVFFLPQSYKKKYDVEEVDNANVLLRAEVLNKINTSSAPIVVVSYTEAIIEKVTTKKLLTENTLTLSQGEKVNIDFITDLLFEYKFERVDFVYEPGQYAVRGGIVDIFSFSNDYPYRVEMFGDEVDSIRSFDTTSQLSVAKHVRINIIPNVQDRLLVEKRESFFEYMPSNTIFWLHNTALLLGKTDKEFIEAQKLYAQHHSIITQLKPEELYLDEQETIHQLSNHTVIEFGLGTYFKNAIEINFNFSPQPSFNKNFQLLLQDLKNNSKRKYKNLLFADTAKQVERFYAIIEDVKIEGDEHLSVEEVTPVMLSFHEGFIDNDLKIACYTDHQIFNRYHRYKLKTGFSKSKEALTIRELQGLNPGDFVTHIDHGLGRFAGLEKIDVNGKQQEAIRLIYKDNDILYVSIHSLHRIAKYSGQEGKEPKINKLGTNTWQNLKQKTKTKVKEIAFDLIELYAKRRSQKGFQFLPDTYLQTELEASFIYEDTPDQEKSTAAVKKDMENIYPMDRLICGDVGFGKTEIAIRAAFKAVADNKQVAILVPTTILALQHYKTFSERLKDFPCTVDYINRFKTAKQQKETLEKLSEGKVDILIGTHRIVGKDVKFKDLGLLIIDEEQKFGVGVKEKLKAFKTNVDTLTLTATPIPRTLQFSMMGARDLSVITTPPPNRYPVQTELASFNEELIRDAISFEISRGGQVFFIHNRVSNIMDVAGMIQRLCPDARVLVGHGQMEGDKLEEVMLSFINEEYDVLVATTIIESGLDIPNANTIFINQAHMFGLSDLHQMRGRVGRSNKKAFCYLLTPPASTLTVEARKRLKAIEEFSELGSGFNIAMRDLDIRGAGNLLGAEQSGFISEIGFEMYMKILDEAIQELKESDFKDVFAENAQQSVDIRKQQSGSMYVRDCQIDTDLEILIPTEYIQNISERMSLYKELDDIEKEEDLTKFENGLIDRFGPIPASVFELINAIRLRWLAKQLGFEKIVLKNQRLVGYFISNSNSSYYQSDLFTTLLCFVQQYPNVCKMKEVKDKLTLSFENVKNIGDALKQLTKLLVLQ